MCNIGDLRCIFWLIVIVNIFLLTNETNGKSKDEVSVLLVLLLCDYVVFFSLKTDLQVYYYMHAKQIKAFL